METLGAVILAFDRCLEMASSDWARALFSGNRAWLWCLLPLGYGVQNYWFFHKPPTFSAVYGAWFYNPHVGYFEDTNGTVRLLY